MGGTHYTPLPKPTCGHKWLRIALVLYMVFFWICGAFLLSFGIYAEVEKRDYQAVSDVLLSPSLIMLVIGAFMFVLNFIGWVGALRENVTLLKIFANTLFVCIFLQLIGAMIAIIWRSKTSNLVSYGIQRSIKYYYDDPDIHFALDTLQLQFECCGGEDHNDWDLNLYFDCAGRGPSSCGVPYSCCVSSLTDTVPNSQCGYKVREGNPNILTLEGVIFMRGCTGALEVWVLDNLNFMMGLLVGFCLPQLVGCVLTLMFINQVIDEQLLFTYQITAPDEDDIDSPSPKNDW